MLQTISGREATWTVAYRLPARVYEQATQRAQARGCKLSVILREAVVAGLPLVALAAGDGGQRARLDESLSA